MPKFFKLSSGALLSGNLSMLLGVRPVLEGEEEAEFLYSSEELEALRDKLQSAPGIEYDDDGEPRKVYKKIFGYVLEYNATTQSVLLRADEFDKFWEWANNDTDNANTDKSVEDVDEHTSTGCPLTQAVFDGAPDDIEYAAMDRNGEVYWYKERPFLRAEVAFWNALAVSSVNPNASSWTRSCIRRKR